MNDIASLIIRALIGLINGIVGIFGILLWSERHTSQCSQVGESRLDREARGWQEWVLASWYWLALAVAISALLGGTLWWFR